MSFREDDLRNRAGHSAATFSRTRRLALNLLRQDNSRKVGVNARRLKACLEQNYLLKVFTRVD